MRKLFGAALIMLTVLFAQAQGSYEDVIYLKNGSIIRGMIIEQVPNQTYKIQTKDRNVFVYKVDEIEKITKETMPGGETGEFMQRPVKQKGVYYTLDIGTNVLITDGEKEPMFSGSMAIGYQPIAQLCVGAGIGVDVSDFGKFLPLFANVRVNFLKKRVTPIIDLSGGYSFIWLESFDGSGNGAHVSALAGVKIMPLEKFGVQFLFGYRRQQIKKDEDYYYYSSSINELMNGFTAKFGISF